MKDKEDTSKALEEELDNLSTEKKKRKLPEKKDSAGPTMFKKK